MSKERQYNGQTKQKKTMIYKTLHRKLTIKHHKPYEDWGWAQMLCKGKKSLKIPRGLSEFINRRTDNTIDKKTQIAMIYKTLHRKLTIKHHKPYEDWGWAQMLCKGKKSLKIPRGLSEFVNPQRTDNTIDKKKPIAMIYKTLHRKLTIKHHEPHKKRVELRCSVKVRRVWRYQRGNQNL